MGGGCRDRPVAPADGLRGRKWRRVQEHRRRRALAASVVFRSAKRPRERARSASECGRRREELSRYRPILANTQGTVGAPSSGARAAATSATESRDAEAGTGPRQPKFIATTSREASFAACCPRTDTTRHARLGRKPPVLAAR